MRLARALVGLALALWAGVAAAQGPASPGVLPGPGLLTGPPFIAGNLTPVAGSAMKIDYLLQNNSVSVVSEAAIWSNEVYAYFAISKEFTATSTPNPATGSGPLIGILSYVVNNGNPRDVTAIIGDVNVKTSNSTGFGGNLIARSNGGGLTGVKLVGLELDVEPAAGDTVSSGGGLFINAFSSAMPIAAIQLGGLSGGTFANGLICNSIATTGACLAPQSGATMNAMMDATAAGTFTSGSAIILGNQQRIKFFGTTTNVAYIYTDSGNNMRFVPPTSGGFFIRNNTDGLNLVQVLSSGNVIIGNGAANATTATNLMLMIPFVAGTPTGVPQNAASGISLEYDTTGKKIWVYDNVSATWKSVGVL